VNPAADRALKEAMDQLGREAEENGMTPEILESLLQEFEEEVSLVRQNQELMEFLDRRSRPSQTYTIDEARKLLGIERSQ
jgi:hypothetical protein